MKLNKSNNSPIGTLFNQLIITLANQLIIVFLIPLFVFSQPTKTYTKTSGTGNPGAIVLAQTDNITTGWTVVTMPTGGVAGANKWSNIVALPFPFKFFGESVTGFKVTLNGLLTFSTAPVIDANGNIVVPSAPGNNSNLPSAALPNKTIACVWDAYTVAPPVGTNDFIYTRTTGVAPNRQFYVKWNSFEIGNPLVNDACFAIMLEENTGAIYIIDMYKGSPSTTNLSATIGLQYDNRYYYSQASTTALSSPTTAYTDNKYMKFTPSPITNETLLYANADLSACSASGIKRTLAVAPTPLCLASTLKSCKLYASLDLGDDYEYGSNGVFADQTGADLAVNGYNAAGTLLFSGTARLMINQTSVEQLYELDITSSYFGLSYITSGISNFIQSANINVQNDVELLVWTKTEFKVNLSGSSPVISLNAVNPAINPVQFSWSPSCPGIPKYEFQLMRLYNEGGESYYDVNKATGTVDWDNALKLIVEDGATSIALHVTEGTGYYAWRVRPIGNYYEGEEANDKNWGLWTSGLLQGATYNYGNSGPIALPRGIFYYTQFDDNLNWIYNRVFTEDNNVGENMTYGDGVGRVKQTQHHLQSADEILVSQQLYDYSGRAALKTMAGPVEKGYFDYQELFLTSDIAESELYRAKDFDGINTYAHPTAVKGGDLVGYYSDNNTDLRIPNAEGYPFSRSLYYADGTNRPKEISTPGALFQIGNTSSGSDRTIKIYYSSVADDELIKVFGEEAAVDTSVYKSIQVDPNKVINVTYHTVDGKTIATCLADGGDLPLLDDLSNTPFVVEDVIEGNISSGLKTYTKEKSFMIVQPTQLWVSYEITPAEIAATCGTYCSTCDYKVYGYIKKEGSALEADGGWDTTITISPSACNSGLVYTFDHEITDAGPGTYTVGRSISIDNDDPASANTYLENHQDTMAAIMDEHIAANFDAMYAYLEDDDVYGFYGYLVTQGLATQEQINNETDIVVNTGCCSVTIPVETCPPHPCDAGTPDFEALLYNMWEYKYGNAFKSYSNNSSVFTYPDNGIINHARIPVTTSNGAFAPTGNWPNSYFIFKIRYTGTDGNPKTFNLGNDTIGFLSPLTSTSTAADIVYAISQALYANLETIYDSDWDNAPYYIDAIISTNILDIWPNLESDSCKGVMKGDVYLYSPVNDFTTSLASNRFNYEPDAVVGEFPFGIGAFNELIGNMVQDGYPCDSLYNTWYALCSSYEFLDENIVEAFLDAVGTMYGKASPVNQYGNDAHPAYLSHAHKAIKYDSGTCPDCELQYDYAAMVASDALDDIRTEPTEDKTWYQFYACTQTCDGNINDELTDLGFDVNSCKGANEIACAEDMVAEVESSCFSLCDSRAGSFEAAIRAEYAAEGLTVTEEEIICLVDALVEECQSGCGLTIFTHWENIPGDGSPLPVEILDSVGSPLEILNLQQSLTYSFDIRIPSILRTDSSCVAMGYKSINGGIHVYEAIEDLMVEELNAYLQAFIDSSADHDTIYGAHLALAITQIYMEYDFIAYPFLCSYSSSDVALLEAIPVDSNAYFYHDGYGHVYLRYCETYNINGSGDSVVCIEKNVLVMSISGDTQCDAYWLCGPICFRWEFPVVNGVPDTVHLITCEESAAEYLMGYIDVQLQTCKDSYITDITDIYKSTCASPENIDDSLTMSYTLGYFHYTLFYYDRGGNLIETVPPKGVDETNDDRRDSPNNVANSEGHYHTYKTIYEYNSRKQMISKTTPDGGVTAYYYNDLGQLRFSQSAQQRIAKKYSYIKYDNLGRIFESGQANICNTCPITSVSNLSTKVNFTSLPATGGEEKTFTVYTTPSAVAYTDAAGLTYPQRFLTNRISYVYTDEDGSSVTLTDRNYTYYSYDPHGNVEWLIQAVAGLGNKQIGFEYDLVSGKITKVKYQEGVIDQYYYKYKYDADNRLVEVQTSVDDKIYDVDAAYEYYAHGPLERVVLGEDKVQGLDYLYTLQGWLKAVNHPQPGYDAGQDGVAGSANTKVATDAFGMVLNYYEGDFNRTGSVYNPSFAPSGGAILNKLSTSSHNTSDYKSYYNGFISNIISNNVAAVSNNPGKAMAGMYLYNEIGQLTQSTIDFYSGSALSGNWLNNTGSASNYYEHFGYDANGNIINVTRNGY